VIGNIKAFNDDILRQRRRELGRLPIPVNIPRSAFLGITSIIELRAKGYTIPYVGRQNVKGFRFVDEIFVDTSGFGRDDEPALSFRQQAHRVRELVEEHYAEGKTLFWGVTQVGQFQAYLGYWTGKGC